jgi:hypothetical protein
MDTSMQSASSGSAADAAATATISTANPESEARLRALIAERGPALRIRLSTPSDFDVSGHTLSAASVTLDVLDDEDDTEGHSISLHFPSVEDAKHFEQRMIATGAIVGTLVIGGSGLALSQALPNAPADVGTQAQVDVTLVDQGGSDVTYPGAISPSTGGALTGKEEALLTQMGGGGPAGTNPFPGAISPSTGGALTGKEQGLLTVMIGSGSGSGDVQVGTSSSSGDELSGKQEALLEEITGE